MVEKTSTAEELQELQLEKARLEKVELEAKIKNVETPRERWFKLSVAAFVPLITVCIALTAAYLELRRVQDEKQQVQDAKAALEKLKEADFQKARVDKALALLSGPTSTATPKVFLAALQDILLSGVQATPNLVNAVAGFVGHSENSISETASEVLTRLNAPEIVAAAITSRLFEATGPVRLHLLRVLLALPADKIESDLSRLLSSGDAIVAGAAAFALATSKDINWTRIDLNDTSKPPEVIDSQLSVVLLQQNLEVRTRALLRPLDGLLQRNPITLRTSTPTPVGRAACYFLSTSDRLPNVELLRDRLTRSTDIAPTNRMILHALMGAEQDKKDVVKIYEDLRKDPKEIKKLDRLVFDLVQKRLGMDKELMPLPYTDDYVQGLTSEVSSNWASHLDWTTVPIAVLKGWADQAPQGDDAYSAFRSRARDQIFDRLGALPAILYFEEIKLPPRILISYWSREDSRKERMQEYLDEVMKTRGFSIVFEVARALEFVRDAALVEKTLQTVFERDPDFVPILLNRINIKVHRDVALKMLKQVREKSRLNPSLILFVAAQGGLGEQVGEWASSAAIQGIQELETSDLSQYLKNARQYDGRFLQSLGMLSLVSEKRLREDLEARFSKILNSVPALLINDFSSGGFGAGQVLQHAFRERLVGFVERRAASWCGQESNVRGADAIMYKILFAKYALGLT
jgi:hypothetical protein